MTSPDADVIIVGSGPAGVSAAWPLVEAGVRVLMIDASGATLPYPPQPSLAALRTDPTRWRTELGPSAIIDGANLSPKFATPLAAATLAGFAAGSRIEADGFMAVGSHAAGGLSRIWGALAARYAPGDLANFPGGGAALEASYDRVSQRIGVTGGRELADADPASLSPPLLHLTARHRRRRRAEDVRLITAPNAVLTQDRGDRRGCDRCGLCLHGCSKGSIYHAALELPALRRFSNFSYRTGLVVERLSAAGGGQVVHARTNGQPVTLKAQVVVLAMGTIATTGVALRRLNLQRTLVRIESNPVGGMAFIVPHLIGGEPPERSFGLGQIFHTAEIKPGIEAAGVFYGADTLPLAPIADKLPFTRPFAMRTARALAPALVLATAYLPGRFSDNQVMVEEDGRGGRIRVAGRQSAEAERLLSQAFRRLGRFGRERGLWAIPGSSQILMPGADAHPAGTLPMGGRGAAATSATGELIGAPGVFIVDGAALPTLSARHPTLTIMANADRIGLALARRLSATPSLARVG